jgi:hypothetical protein
MEYSLYSLKQASQASQILENSNKNVKLMINGIFLNSDSSLFSLATENGYRIFETYNFNLVSEVDEIQNMIGALKLVVPFYQSNILVFVGKDENSTFSNSQLILWDDSKKKKIGVILLKEKIYDAKITKQAFFILLKNKILVFSVTGFKFLTTIYDIDCRQGLNENLVMTYISSSPITILNLPLARNNQIKITKCKKIL